MENPIMEYYRGRPIRRYNMVKLRVSQFEFKKFLDAQIDFQVSAREVLEASGRPCDRCKNSDVEIYKKKKGEKDVYITMSVKRGFLKEK